MRKVTRDEVAIPSILQSESVRKARAAMARHLRLPDMGRHSRRAPIERDLFSNMQVREHLDGLFKDKCAYCESPIGEGNRAIDHFRPPGYASGLSDRSTSPDHYAWLAYEWDNLFLVCFDCNKNKQNIFPVEGPRAPILCSLSEANSLEKFILLDPSRDEPWKHLRFDSDGNCIPNSKRGNATIKILQLNRATLLSQRRDKIARCLEILRAINGGVATTVDLDRELSAESDHPGAAIIFLREVGRFLAKRLGEQVPAGIRVLRSIERLLKVTSRDILEQAFSGVEYEPVSPGSSYIRGPRPPTADPVFPALRYLEKRQQISDHSRIVKIDIKNFKGISNLTLQLGEHQVEQRTPPCLMVLGENSTGKSSLLQAIALCLMGDERREKLRLDPEVFLSREPADWKLAGENYTEIRVYFESGDCAELKINPLRREFEGALAPSTIILAYGASRFFDGAAKVYRSMDAMKTMFHPLSKIAHPNAWMEKLDQETFGTVARAMREILALRYEDEVILDPEGRIFVSAHGRVTPIDKLSDGYQSLFAMAVDVMREMLSNWGSLEVARGVVLIDEIEIHLHPRWKMQVMSALRRALPNVQFIATTHDPLCLRGMGDDEVVVLYRDGDNVVRPVENLPPISGMRAEQILTSDYFGLASTADPDFEAELSKLGALAGIPRGQMTQEERSELEQLESIVRTKLVLGDTPADQVIGEAMARYLVERASPGPVNRKTIREGAVVAVLDALKTEE